MLTLLTTLLLTAPAAAVTAEEAEQIRLSEEMKALARRSVWVGVDRMYRDLMALGAELNEKQHIEGAHAAWDIGDVQACYDRLRAAARLAPSKETIDWLWAIDTQYGQVAITAAPGVVLTISDPPLDAVQRKAIEQAAEILAEEGRFVGMLPAGAYQVGQEALQVTSGRRTALAL